MKKFFSLLFGIILLVVAMVLPLVAGNTQIEGYHLTMILLGSLSAFQLTNVFEEGA